MSKKILLINGSHRKKNTYNLLLQVESALKKLGMDTEILNLFDHEIKDCVGCEVCVTSTGCKIPDDMPKIMQKIKDSDGIVFGSPVYMCSVTSKFKSFADRTNIWVHKPELFGKPVLCVTTTAATGTKEIARFFDQYITGLGVRKGGIITRKGKKMTLPIKEKELTPFISLLNRDKSLYRPAMGEIVMYNVGKVLALKSAGDDNQFWKENNLVDKLYYYKCKINPLKKLFSKFMFKVLTKAMS